MTTLVVKGLCFGSVMPLFRKHLGFVPLANELAMLEIEHE